MRLYESLEALASKRLVGCCSRAFILIAVVTVDGEAVQNEVVHARNIN